MRSLAPISASQTTSEALAVILRHNFDALLDWQDTARTWDDIEGVHQLRVSFRRMRSALNVFKPALPKDQREIWSRTIKALVDETGAARDIDVLIEEALPAFRAANTAHPGERAVLDALTVKRHAAYDKVRTMLDGLPFDTFKSDFGRWIDVAGWRLGDAPQKKRKNQERVVHDFARKRLDKHNRMVVEQQATTDPGDPAAMHKLRIACKKLRYATEFFTPLFDGMDDYTRNLKAIQDTLGLLHDTAVMHDLLGGLLPPDAGQDAYAFVEDLTRWREAGDREKVRHFAEQWQAFADNACPWRVD